MKLVETGEPAGAIEWSTSRSNFSKVIAHGGVLQIDRTSFSDEATYRCTPVNALGRGAFSSVVVKVVGATFDSQLPRRLALRAADSMQADQTLTLECSLCTQPMMSVVWFHEGMRLEPNDRFLISQEYFKSSNATCKNRVRSVLRFAGPSRPKTHGLLLQDYGTYSCFVALGDRILANSSTFLDLRRK